MADIPLLTTHRFSDLPLSNKIVKTLNKLGFEYLTSIQNAVLPLALERKNVLAESPTGSGKTLAFLLPVIERLGNEGFGGPLPTDISMLGCICLSPTRELAMQSAKQMEKLAEPFGLSVGCCIGGVGDKRDKATASKHAILVGTPGRILALLESQALVDLNNVSLLVLDEADRLVDMGFKQVIFEIVNQLPSDLQVLLFSATVKNALSDLCRLVLRSAPYEMVSLGNDFDGYTNLSKKLHQEYWIVPTGEKLYSLFNFLCFNQKRRILVFFATCKQVRLVYQLLKRTIPAISFIELHGKQSQLKRSKNFCNFSNNMKSGCFLTTDVTARGIDFPQIHCVVQVDLPDSIETYIHRIGRTARFTEKGRTIIFLTREEAPIVESIRTRGMIIKDGTHGITASAGNVSKKRFNFQQKLKEILTRNPEIKMMAQRACIAHYRSLLVSEARRLRLLADGDIMERDKQEIGDLAMSFGLAIPPVITIASGRPVSKPSKLAKLKDKIKAKVDSKHVEYDMNIDIKDVEITNKSDTFGSILEYASGSDEEILTVKRVNCDPVKETLNNPIISVSDRKKLRLNKRGIGKVRGTFGYLGAELRHKTFSDSDSHGDSDGDSHGGENNRCQGTDIEVNELEKIALSI
ncbi:DEAD/DEAH box helicase [Babesia microti strain RI]|uniref:ATP-dependent RNA helicase n=1 Tax=Babesia microti (strain RI) TaxID=1133968 RepID=A0A1N6LX48_BABMR|nr:DEAD/DEAH box helicase [Babesia microti strain RI]SIO73443.1 DEAD/DEAH box helicase [Babesia microti strain RI]|eukprot:XP_021337541.1 DEAD/DEAH box helicase [Babesia microti strain RI]